MNLKNFLFIIILSVSFSSLSAQDDGFVSDEGGFSNDGFGDDDGWWW